MGAVVVRWAADDRLRDGLLRQVVAEVAGVASSVVVVERRCARCGGPHGRPRVRVAGRRGPHVGVARADGVVVVAVADAPVGVDVERAGALDEGALRTWVRMEAVLKATGHGLEVDPSLVTLSRPHDPPRLVAWHGPGRRPALRIADVDAGAGLVVTVARLGRPRLRVDAAPAALSDAC